MRWATLVVLVASASLPGSAWASTSRFALVVGNNAGADPAAALRFAERDASKFGAVLRQLGDVPRQNLVLLRGRSAASMWRALRRLEARIVALAAREPERRSLLIFYYSGHADDRTLQLGRSTVRFDALVRFFKASKATVRLALLDACHSGRAITYKAPRAGPAYPIRLTDRLDSSGYALVTSSAANELAQEAEEVRGSFFTHYLVSALRGAADASGDGKVTLGEAYRYAYARTVARTAAQLSGGQHPMYRFQLSGRGEVVLTRLRRDSARLSVKSDDRARLLLLDGSRTMLLAEAGVAPGQQTTLALAPGDYGIYLVGSGMAYRRSVRLRSGEQVKLTRRDFERFSLRQSVAKGGLFRPIWSSRAGVSVLMRRWPLGDGDERLSYGASLHYHLLSPGGWFAALRGAWTTTADVGASTGFDAYGLLAGAGHRWRVGPVRLGVEALVGVELISQTELQDERRRTAGFDYLGMGSVALPLGRLELHLDGGVGGRVFRLLEAGLAHELDLQLLLGAAWRFEH